MITQLARIPVIYVVTFSLGCASTSKLVSAFPIDKISSPTVQVIDATAEQHKWGLLVKGNVIASAASANASERAIDIEVVDRSGKILEKMSTPYFPAPPKRQKKPFRGHFAAVFAATPLGANRIKVSSDTPQPTKTPPAVPRS